MPRRPEMHFVPPSGWREKTGAGADYAKYWVELVEYKLEDDFYRVTLSKFS